MKKRDGTVVVGSFPIGYEDGALGWFRRTGQGQFKRAFAGGFGTEESPHGCLQQQEVLWSQAIACVLPHGMSRH